MDPSDRLLSGAAAGPSVATDESSLLKPKPPGVKYDIVNECQMLIKAEDGGGDTRLSLNEHPERDINESPEFIISTQDQNKEDSTESIISNPGFSMEGMPEHPSGVGLPETVTVLDTPDGGKIYLVGTAHFSLQSQEDVAKVIQKVQPHIVVVELCGQRTNILMLDEEIILKEAKNINIKKIRATVAQNGVFNGLMYILLLNMSAHITRELGMAPGGEFRRAMAEAKKIPYCMVHLGDRAIDVTLHRAIASLSWGQTVRFIWHLLTSNQTISLEEVEKCKQKKMLEDMLDEMAEEFPALKRVFVVERDMYLCHSLQVAAMQPQFYMVGDTCIKCVAKKTEELLPQFRPRSKSLPRREPCRIVGVVGIGHVAGIVEHWGKIRPEDIKPLLKVPPPSLSTRVVRVSVRAALAGAALYAGYRLVRRLLP